MFKTVFIDNAEYRTFLFKKFYNLFPYIDADFFSTRFPLGGKIGRASCRERV